MQCVDTGVHVVSSGRASPFLSSLAIPFQVYVVTSGRASPFLSSNQALVPPVLPAAISMRTAYMLAV